MMYGKDKPMYKKEKKKQTRNYMSNPTKDSGTGSCTSKSIRNYN